MNYVNYVNTDGCGALGCLSNHEARYLPLLDVVHEREELTQSLGPGHLAHEVRALGERRRGSLVPDRQVLCTHPWQEHRNIKG